MKKRPFLVLFTLLSAVFGAAAQSAAVIYLRNPSFEEKEFTHPKSVATAVDWVDCGGENETPPDIQPGLHDVSNLPSDGDSYISMVIRKSGTYEALAQPLPQPLLLGTSYLWFVDLCTSDAMTSPTSLSHGKRVPFDAPAKFYVWGGNTACEKAELLDSTDWVKNTNWKRHTFTLNPRKNSYQYLRIEICTAVNGRPTANGNVLVDNVTPLFPLTDGSSDSLLTADFLKEWFNPRLLSEHWKGGPGSGSLHLADGLTFSKNDKSIKSSGTASLEALVKKLNKFSHLKVEIGAHTAANVDNATEVSAHRAQLVANWLIKKGIDPQRITHKGYGKTMLFLYDEKARGEEARNCVVVRVE